MNKKNILLGMMTTVMIVIGCCLLFWPGGLDFIKQKTSGDVNHKTKYQRIDNFDDLADRVIVKKDVAYTSGYNKSQMDIYIPKENLEAKKPIIFWAHGGAYIAGDKKSVSDYSIMLASQGYVVVNLNYGLAPKYKYPTPIYQVGNAYTYMVKHAKKYGVDVDKIAFGGDSAGGQIMGQFVNVQVNKEYADMLDMEQMIKPNTIKAVIFFSALLDLNKYDENDNENANYVFDKSAQAYFNIENWKFSDKVEKANIVGNVDETYPPTYLTDGNTASFQDQAEQLTDELENSNVSVTTTFFPGDQAELRHQYQFNMELDEAVENYKNVSAFLEKYMK